MSCRPGTSARPAPADNPARPRELGLSGCMDTPFCAEVSVVPVTSADAHILDGADPVVVGGPTHTHGMSSPSTRKMARKPARKPGSEVELVPGVDSGPGVREWLASLGRLEVARQPLIVTSRTITFGTLRRHRVHARVRSGARAQVRLVG